MKFQPVCRSISITGIVFTRELDRFPRTLKCRSSKIEFRGQKRRKVRKWVSVKFQPVDRIQLTVTCFSRETDRAFRISCRGDRQKSLFWRKNTLKRAQRVSLNKFQPVGTTCLRLTTMTMAASWVLNIILVFNEVSFSFDNHCHFDLRACHQCFNNFASQLLASLQQSKDDCSTFHS